MIARLTTQVVITGKKREVCEHFGGMAALVQGNLALGEAVEIDVHFQEQDFNVVAIVRHTSAVRSGFEPQGMTSEERAQIAAIISRNRRLLVRGD